MKIWSMLLNPVLFVAATVLLYFGSGMLLFVPRAWNEPYFVADRVIYGVIPFVGSCALLVLVGRNRARDKSTRGTLQSIATAFAFAVSALVVFWIGAEIFVAISRG